MTVMYFWLILIPFRIAKLPSLAILIGIRVQEAWWACWCRKVYGKESQSISRHSGSRVSPRATHSVCKYDQSRARGKEIHKAVSDWPVGEFLKRSIEGNEENEPLLCAPELYTT